MRLVYLEFRKNIETHFGDILGIGVDSAVDNDLENKLTTLIYSL